MPSNRRSKTALVLAGGGMTGAAYEIGALTAIDTMLAPDFSTGMFDVYVGTSVGSIMATLMANQMKPLDIYTDIVDNKASLFNWRREDIYRIDRGAIWSNLRAVLSNVLRVIKSYKLSRWELTLSEIMNIFQEQLPAGLYSLDPLQSYLCDAFRKAGIADAFDRLETELYITAYNLDTPERVVFGSPQFRDLHICTAIAASCAYPLFYRPFQIGNQHYVDGAVGKADHLDVAIDTGATLVVMVNPRVPIENRSPDTCLPSLSLHRCASISELGVTFAWEQSQRISSIEKINMALEINRLKHPDVDIVVIEPTREETLLFLQGSMSIEGKKHIMLNAFNQTRWQLMKEFDRYQAVFERHGIRISKAELEKTSP